MRRADNQVRITAQLIDATTQADTLWSERYDRPLMNFDDQNVGNMEPSQRSRATGWQSERTLRLKTRAVSNEIS